MEYCADYAFSIWESCLKNVLNSFDNAILVGHSFSGLYPLLFPEIEKDLIGLVILHSASRPWIDNCINAGNATELPSLDEELTAFLAQPTDATFDHFFKKAVHYYFTPQALQKGTELLSRNPWNYYALHWWLSQAASIDFHKILIPTVPTLIIGGSLDKAVPFAGYLSDVRFHKSNILMKEIEGGSHVAWLEKPQDVKILFDQYLTLLEKP